MDLKTIKRLVEWVEAAQITSLSVEIDGAKIEIKKEAPVSMIAAPAVASVVPVPTSAPTPVATAQQAPASAGGDPHAGLLAIKSQMVGTYYSSPKPDAPSFVKVGDVIQAGQVLCIIEAMKLFNEIESEVQGVVEEIPLTNGTPVEYGQVLFWIRPQ